jgi:hypothetical protein
VITQLSSGDRYAQSAVWFTQCWSLSLVAWRHLAVVRHLKTDTNRSEYSHGVCVTVMAILW